MADFNRSFLDHIKKTEEEREKELIKISSIKSKLAKYPGERLLRKYKHKIWHNKLPVIKKKISKFKREDIASGNSVKKISWPKQNNGKFEVNSRQSFEPTLLPEIGPCTEFPIAEIGTEVNGNRNNGNSPFNSSSSCNSPPDTHLFSKSESSHVTSIEKSTCQKCRIRNSEQNNNTDLRCTCININVSHDLDFGQKKSANSTDSENMDSEPEGVYQNAGSDPLNDTLEPFIDVESLDDSGEIKITQHITESSDHITEMSENGIDNEPMQYVGSKTEESKSNKQSIDWQQQFMSFLSSSSSTTVITEDQDIEMAKEGSKFLNSPRRKRSRKVRQSMCPCCLGSTHGRKKDHEDLVRYRKPHSTMRSQRKFIRDMTQLVSLRNKVMEVCRVLFPKCVSEIFNYTNPESDDVDKCVDQMISILHKAHQQFLQNLNSNTEKNLNSKPGVKLKFKSSKRPENLKYDQINSNECIVSIFESSLPVGNTASENNVIGDQDSKEISPSPILFRSQADQLKEQSDPPEILTDICLPENEGIVYAIPVENGIAYPEQTQVLMTGNSDQTDYYNENVFSEEKQDENKLQVKGNKEQYRMLSEADSGIINDHDPSSPEETDNKNNVFQKTCPLWDGTFCKSKTSPLSAKSEHKAANIFDLLANYTPTKSVHKHDQSESGVCVLQSSHETKKTESPVKAGDRNIFDSLFNMNVHSTVSNNEEYVGNEISSDGLLQNVDQAEEEICDQEVQSFYLPLNEPPSEKGARVSQSMDNRPKSTYVEVYDPAIVLCKKPKICLHAFKEKVSSLIKWLLPEITFEKGFLKNTDNIEYVLDALVLCNKKL